MLLKLRAHQAEADALAAADPDLCTVGRTGWTTLTFTADDAPDMDLIKRWIDDSYRISAPKKLLQTL